jgi:PQQ-dependent dehydrogenase (methanol/ethanol family)
VLIFDGENTVPGVRLIVIALSAASLSVAGCDEGAAPDRNEVSAPAPENAQTPGSGAGDWPAYNRTLAGDRFSPLEEINRDNVAGLEAKCSYTLPEVLSLQTGPLVIAGEMYFTTEASSYAIDAATCAETWRVEHALARRSPLGVNRGFAYLDGRLFRGTTDGRVLALDAGDGHMLWEQQISDDAPGVSIPMAPIAANGLVFIGHAGGDQTGVTGHAYAFDAADGRLVWRFDVVPDEEAVLATWPNRDRYPMTGGAFWTSFTLDSERNVLYVPAGNPAPDFDVEARGGDNLYTNSVIALDAATGRMLGYNQIVKRDNHDWDVNSPPALATTRSGRPIVASANKDGLLSVLDRTQLASPSPTTQDVSARLPVVFQSPTTTRENVDVPLSRSEPVRFCPGIQGGNEWNGAAFHPGLNLLYTGAVDWCATVQLQQEPEVPSPGEIWFGSTVGEITDPRENAKGWLTAFDADSGAMRWQFAASSPVLAVTPTAGGVLFSAELSGQLRAFDADTGDVLWELDTGQAIGGGIVSYSAGGRQLIAVATGMKSMIWPSAEEVNRIRVFGLP